MLGTTFALFLAVVSAHSQPHAACLALNTTSEKILPSTVCDIAVVGSGWSSAYFVWRLIVDTPTYAGQQICVFEADDNHIGGRAYDWTVDNFMLDMSAYRYENDQPLIKSLSENALKMPFICYGEPQHENCMSRVYSFDGKYNNGFVLGVERLFQDAQAAGLGAIWMGHKLVHVGRSKDQESDYILTFSNGAVIKSNTLFLNTPPAALRNLQPSSILFTEASDDTLRAYKSTEDIEVSKLYLFYEDAWWQTKLGFHVGEFFDYEVVPPIRGRYHDGPIKCTAPNTCHGALLASFISWYETNEGTEYFMKYQRNPLEPVTEITQTYGADLLEAMHQSLMNFHRESLLNAGIDPETIPLPVSGVLGSWHTTPEQDLYPGLMIVPNGQAEFVLDHIAQPLSGESVFMANAGWCNGNYAEQTLQLTERILRTHFSLEASPWMASAALEKFVRSKVITK